jgi:hypothetical protein
MSGLTRREGYVLILFAGLALTWGLIVNPFLQSSDWFMNLSVHVCTGSAFHVAVCSLVLWSEGVFCPYEETLGCYKYLFIVTQRTLGTLPVYFYMYVYESINVSTENRV